MINSKKLAETLLKNLKFKCPYCGADVSYAYYGYNGERYCPKCIKRIDGDNGNDYD